MTEWKLYGSNERDSRVGNREIKGVVEMRTVASRIEIKWENKHTPLLKILVRFFSASTVYYLDS